MKEESLFSFLVPIFLLVLSFIFRAKKKEAGSRPPPGFDRPQPKAAPKKNIKAPLPPVKQVEQPSFRRQSASSSYEVIKKKRGSFFSAEDWKDKSSLQKAFLMSEILKKIDD